MAADPRSGRRGARRAGRLRPDGLAQDLGLARHPRDRANRSAAGASTRCGVPRWRWRARWSAARRRCATSKWWKEERHGVFVDYNQNAKDRTVASAYSVRPRPDARVSAPVSWRELESCDPADFTLRTMPARSPASAIRTKASMPRVCSLDRAAGAVGAARARRRRRRALAAALPQAGRRAAPGPPSTAPAGTRKSSKPLIEIAGPTGGRRAGGRRAVEGAPSQGRGPPAAGRRAGGPHARLVVAVVPGADQPGARAGAAAAEAGEAGSGPRALDVQRVCQPGLDPGSTWR